MQDMNAFNLQLQMHKYCFDILILKHWILIFKIIIKNWKGTFDVKLKPPAGGSN